MMQCVIGLVYILSELLVLSGVAILGVGIWILADPNLQDYIDVIHTEDEEYFRNAAYLLIAFGAFVFLVGFCGCCGAIRNSKCLLGFYIFFLVLVFAGELAAGILAAVYKDQIIDKFDVQLTDAIKNDYKDNPSSWDVVQKELKCCGGLGPGDYDNSTWQNAQGQNVMIPVSCCKLDGTKVVDQAACQEKTSSYYEQGCKSALEGWVNDHSMILIGVGCGIAALQIFGLVFAICLCRSIDQEKY
nr:hypothetical protein BaRGS_002168 [Batillaria attramentaria]